MPRSPITPRFLPIKWQKAFPRLLIHRLEWKELNTFETQCLTFLGITSKSYDAILASYTIRYTGKLGEDGALVYLWTTKPYLKRNGAFGTTVRTSTHFQRLTAAPHPRPRLHLHPPRPQAHMQMVAVPDAHGLILMDDERHEEE